LGADRLLRTKNQAPPSFFANAHGNEVISRSFFHLSAALLPFALSREPLSFSRAHHTIILHVLRRRSAVRSVRLQSSAPIPGHPMTQDACLPSFLLVAPGSL
ncbi:unnamed protein product, partial [Tilletia controversa]